MLSQEQIEKTLVLMRADLAAYKAKYRGVFDAKEVHIGDNRKTKCVNEATLPILTCDGSCREKCAPTCYVMTICTAQRPACRACEARNTVLRRLDPEGYYEVFYKAAEKEHLPIRLADGGDFEDEVQVQACLKVARRHPTVRAIVYTKRLNLLPAFVDRPETLHVRYSGWVGDEAGEAEARRLGFDVTHVVADGSGNCPYQHSLARFTRRAREIARALRKQGVETKAAKKQSERQAAAEITVWHCRDCAQHGTGCCGKGDIRFNVVGESNWAVKAQEKRQAQ